MDSCPHRGGWTHHGGESRCDDCGVRRFTEYGAVRPSDLPYAVTPPTPARHSKDRVAALNISQAVTDSRRFLPAPWSTARHGHHEVTPAPAARTRSR
ncbi:DUF6255 family natural product biosynthesis protein [Streptomyces albireticuli]|uniref:DUF6255 family natural product biosynthesis protein n=1 Tax=Streptomyces albireticuli TaxID=1940 RepID=UPI003AF0AD26